MEQKKAEIEAELRKRARYNTGKLLDAGIDDDINESQSSSGEYYDEDEEGEAENEEMDPN